ncbi:sigma-70 family RNA polymerase sigma factor [Candidatus Frankia alpina]|uniref:Sigma-70 family RNA polymerase sigma factor n=1 Tax=Candidatus Frankia alpina TaxID=2699483 RepID=A0A4S5ESH2_9ACTN|nr:sigma-70 family RNA polymerase sigma factor [Candidatus Frankia alpina]
MVGELETLGAVDDPLERARRAGGLIDAHQATINELSRIRREALEYLVSTGMTQKQIGERLGMSRARVGQLLKSGPQPERAFLGTGRLIFALGGKLEAGKASPGPVVSDGTLAAYHRLAELARTLDLGSDFEVIEPPGIVTLNRANLVVICGPRLSPLVAQVLESDPRLAFHRDDQGWHIVDRETGDVHRSSLDSGGRTDIAYLGRLPRPDGRGTFLYLAGIHAAGTSGAAHYLEAHLPELYAEVKTKRFSTLITCDVDPETKQVVASERLTPLIRHDG